MVPVREPLIFLHGFLGSSSDWNEVQSHLSSFRCISIDLPGHGHAPFSKTFDIPLPFPQFHLIGYSMGGRLALQYAIKNPERIKHLLIASAHPGLPSEEDKQKRLQQDAQWARWLLELPIDEFLKRWYDQPIFAGFKPDFSMRRQQNIRDLAEALLTYSLGTQPILKVEKAIHIVGEKDVKFRALHPSAVIVPNAGHAVHLENPRFLAQIIRATVLSI